MTSGVALTSGGVRVEGARERHPAHGRQLRLLPPAPRAYSEPRPPRGEPVGPVRECAVGAPGRDVPAGGIVPLRLTARGRRLVVVLLLLLALGVLAFADAVLGGGEGELQLMGTASTVVEPGETLWSIASDVAGTRDVRQVIDEIQLLNGLDDASIEPGQLLRLP